MHSIKAIISIIKERVLNFKSLRQRNCNLNHLSINIVTPRCIYMYGVVKSSGRLYNIQNCCCVCLTELTLLNENKNTFICVFDKKIFLQRYMCDSFFSRFRCYHQIAIIRQKGFLLIRWHLLARSSLVHTTPRYIYAISHVSKVFITAYKNWYSIVWYIMWSVDLSEHDNI